MAASTPWLQACAADRIARTSEAGLLALLAAPVTLRHDLGAALAALPAPAIPALLDRIAYHRIDGLAHRALAQLPDGGIHPWIRSVLKRRHQTCAAATISQGLALAEVLEALHRAGIPASVIGGVRAAESSYADPGARPVDRHDLLVRPRDLEAAGPPLRPLGFEIEAPGRHRRGTVMVVLRADHDGQRRSHCETEWSLSSGAVLGRATPGLVAGAPALLPALEDELLLGALDLVRNSFDRLIRVADLAHCLSRRGAAVCWETIRRRAHASGLSRVLSWSLEAAAMLGVPVRSDFRLDTGAGLIERTLVSRALELRAFPCTGRLLMLFAAGRGRASRTWGIAGSPFRERHHVS